jgi:hypothetical protein
MSTSVPPQIGVAALAVKGAPRFTNYVVVDDTWERTPSLQMLMTRDGNSNVFNYTGWSPGDDVQADWHILKGQPEANPMDIVVENLPLLFSVQPTAGLTISVGATTYTFRAAVAAADDVLIGATLAATILNFKDAVMATMAALGATVGTGTTANASGTAVVDPSVMSSVLLVSVSPWSPATALQVSGTYVGGFISGVPLSATSIIARPFVVQQEPKTKNLGGRPVRQSVKLKYHSDGFVCQTVT